ncbi:MAG: cytochrome d ubiquinol oxidase subunit II [Bacteroidales bacterium]|nr:cytochrome d ubiquinol oxidase subunit II [Bacteroidales bacterium]
MTYSFLQHYWWIVVSLLGAILVFLLFVQGGNFLAMAMAPDKSRKRMMYNSTGRKWDLTFTTLVTFGGAFFASFPLFYSTSFSGAYWVWIIILITFVFQAVSYEFQNKKGNLIGEKPFQIFLALNGVLGPLLIGTAVGTFFTGANFKVDKSAILAGNAGSISSWTNNWHGLDALGQPWAVVLGISVLLLAIMLGGLYMTNNIDDEVMRKALKPWIRNSGAAFVVLFVAWLVHLLVCSGFAVDETGVVAIEKYKYLHNFLQMPLVTIIFLAGVVLVLGGWYLGSFTNSLKGIWSAGLGAVLAVFALLLIAGFNGTAYYPSISDLQSSLSIANSSSSYGTLKTMFFVSFAVPFVIAYISYAWRAMDKKSITKEEIETTDDKY